MVLCLVVCLFCCVKKDVIFGEVSFLFFVLYRSKVFFLLDWNRWGNGVGLIDIFFYFVFLDSVVK